jgi:hypothetical protein
VVRKRSLLLGASLAILAVVYVAAFAIVRTDVRFAEETFASPIGADAPLDIYIDVTTIDPVRQSMELRIDVANGPGAHGTHYFGRLSRDVELRVSDGEVEQDFLLRRGQPLTSSVFSAGLQGAVGRYPFDRYTASIVVSAAEPAGMNAGKAIPVRITIWEGVQGWFLRVMNRSGPGAEELTLAYDAHRPVALVCFSCVIYGLMVLIAVCAVAIGTLTFVGVRRIEVTLVGALTAMVFTLPVLRNTLPGAPPLGIPADIFILLLAEIAAIVGLTLLVTAWVQRGPKP